MSTPVNYNKEEARRTELAYGSPEVVRQRRRSVEIIGPSLGEQIVDIGCGPGLLVVDLASRVGDFGTVVGIDSSPAMIELATRRCAGVGNAELRQGDATKLDLGDESMDVAICTQVLLYVDDFAAAITEMYRVLKPGGRVYILETDWRSTVLHSNDEPLTEKIIEAWDKAVPSPRLPARLFAELRAAGFSAVNVEAIPMISTTCEAGGFSRSTVEQCARSATEQGTISKDQGLQWVSELVELGRQNRYFFCVNRFLFSALKHRAE